MPAKVRFGSRPSVLGLLLLAGLLLAAAWLLAVQAQAGGRDARPGAQASQTSPSDADYVAGEVLVRLRAGTSRQSAKALSRSLDAVGLRDLRVRAVVPPGQRILLVESATLSGDALVKSALQQPNVIAASLNYRLYADAVTPNDPLFPRLWGMSNTGQTGGTPGADISAPAAWSATTGSAGVVIADIDSGVAYDHPDLAANMWHNPGEIPANRIDDDRNGYVDDVYGINAISGSGDPYDDLGHGTHTAGTMAAAGNNGVGVTGVAWQARIMALKFLPAVGGGTDADEITCIDYVVDQKLNHGVNVVAINASFGGGGYNALERAAINAAGAAGIVFCAAAGNGGDDGVGDDNDTTPEYPSSYDCATIISVAATDAGDALADFSNYGARSVDLGAPGVGILSTVPAAGVSLFAVAFPDATHGWAVGEGGAILVTTNGGATWSKQSSGTFATFWGVAFSDATHGWAVGEGGLILATTNGGATWSARGSGTSELLYDVAFSDATHGWAVGEGGTILATTDGGATWSKQSSGRSTWLHGVAFADATHGWAVGEGGTILATTNGGATWIAQSSGSSNRLYDVAFSDATHAWVVGRDGVILATANGGATWSAQTSGTTERLRGVAFTDAAHGWAVGYGGDILVTTNGGATWSAQSSKTGVDFEAVAFTDATHAWAVGGSGTILATANGGATWSAQSLGVGEWYVSWDGTSMATPHVTGAVALCAARFPSETVAKRVRRILDHVDPVASLRFRTVTRGRLNAAAAVNPVPGLVKLKPASGKRGSTVTVSGTGFGPARGTSSVRFGTKTCTVFVSWSDTQIKCRVPATARNGVVKVTVTTTGGTSNALSFTVKR